MANPLESEDDIFNQLRKGVDPKVQEEKTRIAQERDFAQNEKTQKRLGQLIEDNFTLPATISSICVDGAKNTRKGFLQRIFNPILSANQDRPYTLAEAIREVSIGADKLRRHEIFHEPISLYIDRPDPTNPSTTPTDIDIFLSVKERSRLFLKTGTNVGNAEGDAYATGTLRNIFGGAETLNLNASLGTRTRSAYEANFETPILSNPDFRWQIGGLSSSTSKIWSSHEEILRGGWTKLRWVVPGGGRHELGYNGIWRQITGLASGASPTVREDAGDSVKSSISHTWVKDLRDNPLLPTRGIFNKTTLELAGWGPLQGDVAFGKAEVEAQGALPVPIPGVKGESGVSLTTGIRAGLLYPLPLGLESESKPSRINDRFQLGGPTDVRGFRLSGLGPHDGSDAVGGDIYIAGSANLLLPIPRVPLERPFRFQAFLTGGRLLALKESKNEGTDAQKVRQTIASTIADLGNGLPSTSAGIGLVYAHPVARFELNFSLPLVLRKGEEGRKGLQFGIGSRALAQQGTNVLVNSTESEGNTLPPTLELPIDAFLNATGRDPICTPTGHYNEGLTMSSCEDLIEQIPDTHSAIVDQHGEKLALPARFQSSDGKCTLDLHRSNFVSDRVAVSGKNLRLQVSRILDECVQGQDRSMGGEVKVKRSGRLLYIKVGYYPRWRDVTCLANRSPEEPPPSNCAETLQKMDKTSRNLLFTLQAVAQLYEEEVPEIIIDSKQNCMAVIDLMQDAPTLCSDLMLWEAAVAIDAMCVRRGRPGRAVGLRDVSQGDKALYVVLENGHNRPPPPHNSVLELPTSGDHAIV